MDSKRLRRLCIVTSGALLAAGGACGAETDAVAMACATEIATLRAVHPVVRGGFGPKSMGNIQRAATAHGKALLLWHAEGLERMADNDPEAHPVRIEFWRASASLLRCVHASLQSLPDWQPQRNFEIPTAWARIGDVLLTKQNSCAVFLRPDSAMSVHITPGPKDIVSWRWDGACNGGRASGSGTAWLQMRSGEEVAGVLGNGFAKGTFSRGMMHGVFQVTDGSRTDPCWQNHYERYAAGYQSARYRHNASEQFVPIEYVKGTGGWDWVETPIKVGKKPANRLKH